MEATALHFLILTVGGWMNRRRGDAIEYLEENRVLREHLGKKRLRFSEPHLRRVLFEYLGTTISSATIRDSATRSSNLAQVPRTTTASCFGSSASADS